MIKKYILVTLGSIALIIGIIGIFTPGLPVTPLLLLSAWLYSKGSKRLHKKLMESKWLGTYIKNYKAKGGMTIKDKITAVCAMWILISISVGFMIDDKTLEIIVISAGGLGTIVMSFVVPTVK